MKSFLLVFTFSLANAIGFSQSLNWSTATRTGSNPNYTYTGTGISAVISTNQVTMGDGTPRVDGSSGISACYINPSLALYAGTFNSYQSSTNSYITTTFTFANGYGCSVMSFLIRDINSEESYTTFCDVLEISATYSSNIALPAANITTTLATNVNRSVSGTTVKLVGHSSSTETTGSYSAGSSCGDTRVTITPPAGTPLKSITIKYRPAYGTSTSNAYYNVNPKPASQYVSFGNPTFTATSGCSALPISFSYFNAEKLFDNKVNLKWKTSTEVNSNYFSIERTVNGVDFEEIAQIKSTGSSKNNSTYYYQDQIINENIIYYRLKEIDFDGSYMYSDIVSIEGIKSKNIVKNIFPNPSSSNVKIDFNAISDGILNYQIVNYVGQIVSEKEIHVSSGNSIIDIDISSLNKGVYFIKVSFNENEYNYIQKLIKE